MILSELIYRVSITASLGNMSTEITHITFDSRQVTKGTLFIAIKGVAQDGHEFIPQAIKQGASAILCNEIPTGSPDEIAFVAAEDTNEALARVASNFYGNPSEKLTLVGVTGTNGKTTVATLLYQLFMKLGYHSGLISTICIKMNEEELPSTHTTPDSITLNKLMKQMVDNGVTHCFMEASSHSLVQKRTFGLDFEVAIFTNITRDHLDYHETLENYLKAKKILFDNLKSSAIAISNNDDRRGMVIMQNTKAEKVTYGIKSMADFKGRMLSDTLQGLEMEIDHKEVWFRLIGEFNGYNLLSVYATAVKLGEDSDEVLRVLSLMEGVNGRFNKVNSEAGITGIIDYAHTPDALENVLSTIGKVRTGNEKVITVVGCGGNRDKGKRPLMASIACNLSDKVIFTADNPRFEDPTEIIEDMVRSLNPNEMRKVLKILDREEAIKTACMLADKGDIILLAGKGHEKYQEVMGERMPFDDREVLNRMLLIK